MKSKLMLLATAAMLVATNAQAGFLTPGSQRCTSNRPYGIYKPGSTRQGNCDVAANRVNPPTPRTPVVAGPPDSLLGVPNDTLTPLVQKEIDLATKQTPKSLPPITRDPRLLQYLPTDYFNSVSAIAAFNRLARVEPSYVRPPRAGFRTLAVRLRCLSSRKSETINGVVACKIVEEAGV
jgi:hypothetical protein